MKYMKSWLTFFAAAAGTTATGVALITRFTQNNCPDLARQTVNLIQTVFEGRLPIGVHFGDDNAGSSSTEDMNLSFYLNLNKDLIESIKSATTNIIETSCKATVWQFGMQDVLLALLTLAAGCGVVCAFSYSQRDERADLHDGQDHERGQPFMRAPG